VPDAAAVPPLPTTFQSLTTARNARSRARFFTTKQDIEMTTINLQEHRYDKFSVIGFSVPERVIPIIDELASREFIARSAWLRKTVLAALAKSDRQAA
jgi:hypothetical protein